ncbi:hypothetical protein L218DRAFT_574915 [Marasmius fiardii PR-910]|nr:hypothetical protein L218DRAFT_574915 [Marasmius fiardii PR-910]
MYIVFFGLCMHVLLSCRDHPTFKLYMGWTITLFALASIYTVTKTWGHAQQATIEFTATKTRNFSPLLEYLLGNDQKTAWNSISNIITTLMNATADSMLVYRCYVIWDYNNFVLYPFAAAAVILNGLDLGCMVTNSIAISDVSKYSKVTLGNNVISINKGVGIALVTFQAVLAFITGGRIWWISCQARRLIKRSTPHTRYRSPSHMKYRAIISVIVESALPYTITLMISIILTSVMDNDRTGLIIPVDFSVVTTLMSGLAPTLVAVRVACDRSINSVRQMVLLHQLELEAQQIRRHRFHDIDIRPPPVLDIRVSVERVETPAEGKIGVAI